MAPCQRSLAPIVPVFARFTEVQLKPSVLDTTRAETAVPMGYVSKLTVTVSPGSTCWLGGSWRAWPNQRAPAPPFTVA